MDKMEWLISARCRPLVVWNYLLHSEGHSELSLLVLSADAPGV
jgi:hypothetical protein